MANKDLNKSIDSYFMLQKEIHKAFEYIEDWKVIPMQDMRDDHWMLTDGEEQGWVVHSPEPLTKESIADGKIIYGSVVYRQRFLRKYVYRIPGHVMISADTHSDDNKFLMIFAADKECVDGELRKLYKERWG